MLSKGYTQKRPISGISEGAINALEEEEIVWIHNEWVNYKGRGRDSDNLVIMNIRKTPISQTHIWVVDVNAPDTAPTIMLPSEY